MKKEEKDKMQKEYGIFKFRVPSKSEQIAAMGLSGETIIFKKMIQHEYEKFYDTIEAPDLGDWLMLHKEFGQTYEEYKNGGIIPVTQKKDIIYIAPLSCGENANIDQSFVNALLLICEAYFYGMKVKVLEKRIDLNNYSIDIRIFDENKIQINANQILSILYSELPSNAYCLLAITDKDLYNDHNIIRPRDYIYKPKNYNYSNNFCYGLSSIKSRVGVVSFARYDPLFYTRFVNKENSKQQEKLMKYYFILLKRACKVIVKEVCHLFGLKNCTFFKCNLNGFNSMEEFDKRPLELCPICIRKIYANICLKSIQNSTRMNNPLIIFDRFVKIKDSLSENFLGIFEPELAWYSARIESLKNEL